MRTLAAFSTLFLTALATLLVGCDEQVSVKNGEIPPAAQPQVSEWTGVYRGRLSGLPMDLVVSMEGLKPQVRLKPLNLEAEQCQFEFGDLKTVWVGRAEENIRPIGAQFVINEIKCPGVRAEKLELFFPQPESGEKRIAVRILKSQKYIQQCVSEYSQGLDLSVQQKCHWIPDPQSQPHFLLGEFVK